jgi:hypothetical protein
MSLLLPSASGLAEERGALPSPTFRSVRPSRPCVGHEGESNGVGSQRARLLYWPASTPSPSTSGRGAGT